MNIYQKILESRKEIGYLQKDGKVEFGSTKYKAITDEKVMTTVRPILDKYGLVMTIEQIQMNRAGNITEGVVVWRITNAENPDEHIFIQSAGQGADTQDKGAGKMMTYSRKYALLNTLLIPTGEDSDKISSEELDEMEKEESRRGVCQEKKPERKILNQATVEDRKNLFTAAKTVFGDAFAETLKGWFKEIGVSASEELTKDQVKALLARINQHADEEYSKQSA